VNADAALQRVLKKTDSPLADTKHHSSALEADKLFLTALLIPQIGAVGG
jgi:hypothetical protein